MQCIHSLRHKWGNLHREADCSQQGQVGIGLRFSTQVAEESPAPTARVIQRPLDPSTRPQCIARQCVINVAAARFVVNVAHELEAYAAVLFSLMVIWPMVKSTSTETLASIQRQEYVHVRKLQRKAKNHLTQ